MATTTNHRRFAGVRVLIFDLDGTLIDSKLDLAHSVNAMLEHMGREAHVHETIFGFIGDGAAMLVWRALGEGVTEAEVERGLDYFLKYYRAHMLDNTVAYPGVREALAELAGDSTQARHPARAMTVLTNKPVVFSCAILEGLGLSRYFRFVYGGNSFARKKPDPMGVEVLLRDLQASPPEALMIGDSDVDIKTARNAGIFACGVSYGFGLAGLRAHPPDLMVDSLTELPGHLDGSTRIA
ncbi:MAG: HAD-IA family hydrolase [Candidatus Acidiferrales bacterium]